MLYRNGENTVHSTMFYGNYFAGNGNEGVAEVDIIHKNKKNPYKKNVRKSVTISRRVQSFAFLARNKTNIKKVEAATHKPQKI